MKVKALLPSTLIVEFGASVPGFGRIVDTRTIQDTISVEDENTVTVEVVNVIGPIRISGHDRNTIEYTVTERIRADSRSDLYRAREEVKLQIDQKSDRVEFRVWRSGCDCGWIRRQDYIVEYDFDLHVPRSAELDLSTVNDGEILIDDVHGDIEASNVNGPLILRSVCGSGEFRTVNGELDAVFDQSPTGDLSLSTVNGRIDVTFPTDLSADLVFKSLNGEFWTDFDVSSLSSATERSELNRNGLFVIRHGSRVRVRAGEGGPTHSFETLNSDIYVREAP